MSVKDTEAELDDMWVQIHFKQDSIPSILAGHLTEESKADLLAWRDRCVAEAEKRGRWRTVRSETPKEGEFVLARLEWVSGKEVFAVLQYKSLEDNEPWLCDGDELDFSVTVTHWRYFNKPEQLAPTEPKQ